MKLQNRERGKNLLPTKQEFSHDIRSAIISLAGAVFHVFFSGGDKSLEETSKGYIKKTHTTISIDKNSYDAIEMFARGGKGIIISNHKSGVFSDYLPLFATLGDDILKKCIFYTGSYNRAMNQREFPDYVFRPATLRTRKDVIDLKDQLKNDIDYVNNNGGYIFIIPPGANISEDAEFQALFQRIIKGSEDNLSLLVNYIEHDSIRGYKQIAQSIIGSSTPSKTIITSKLQSVKDWKDNNGNVMKGDEMRKKYNTDMKG